MTTENSRADALTGEHLATLKQAALTVTPQDIDGAERIESRPDGSYITCPACEGEGCIPFESDYCNFDHVAIGVQFYGIGTEPGAAEAYFRAAKPATIIALLDRLERAESALAASPIEQPAAAPIDESGANECSIDFGPGATLKPGPRVTFADGMREAARLIQLWQSMQPAYRQLHSAYNRDASRIIAFWPGRLREAAGDIVAEQPAPSPADERAFPATDGYFVYDRAGGHVEFYDTDAERDAAHREAIAEYRRDAIHDQEWPTEVEGIVSGVVTHMTAELKVHEDSFEFEPRAVASQARAASANETGAEGALIERLKLLLSGDAAFCRTIVARAAIEQAIAILSRSPAMAAEAVDWRELSRRLYVELFHCDQQMRSTRDEEGEPHWTQSAVVRDVLADAKAALDGAPAQAAEAVAIPPLVRYQILTEEGGWLDVPQAYYERFKGDPTLTRVVNPMQPMAAHDESSIEKHFDDYGFYLHGFEEEDREAFFQAAMALIAAPQPAQADARVGLTDEQREAIGKASEVLSILTGHDAYPNMRHRFGNDWWEPINMIADALRALLQGANHAE